MKKIENALDQAVASLDIDNLKITKEQKKTIKEKLKNLSNDKSLIEELLRISEEENKHGRIK